MTRDEMLKVLKDSFKDFKFYEDGHYYTYKDKPVGISVTRFIAEYENEFNQQEVAEKVAEKNSKIINDLYRISGEVSEQEYKMYPTSVQDILTQWKYKADFACAKGTTCHEYAQTLWSEEQYKIDRFDESKEYYNAIEKIQYQADDFYNDYKDRLEHLQDELVVGSDEYDIASAVDHLFYNKLTGGLVLVDYKTNSTLKGYNDDIKNRKYTKKMKVPLHNIDDDSLHHYYIQLSIYKFLIEKYTGLKVDEMFIVYMSENIENYEIIEIPYLKDEVEDILEIRRVKNMKSIPVLIMGASGTGKSYSFKNLPPEETAIISVAKSELPFRNKTGLKFVECDDYSKIASAIQNTKKRIICLDDTGYLMQFENFDKAMIKGYDKHTEMAKHYADLLKVVRKLNGEKIVYMTIHEDIIEGIAKPKTTGKMINDNLCIEGLLNIVFRSVIKEGEHVFQTRSAGDSVAKTPDEMYEEEFIPNDLAEIDKVIREYYGFKPINEKLDKVESDEK